MPSTNFAAGVGHNVAGVAVDAEETGDLRDDVRTRGESFVKAVLILSRKVPMPELPADLAARAGPADNEGRAPDG
jgi:hypothetical protein